MEPPAFPPPPRRSVTEPQSAALWKTLPPPPTHPIWEDAASSISSRRRKETETRHGKTTGPRGPAFTGYDRFGWLVTIVLVLGTLCIVVALGLVLFLWLAPPDNERWFRFASSNTLKTAVTLSSLVLRTAASWQASAATMMLAALALEHVQVPVLQLASVSTMRNTNSGPYYFTWLMLDAFRRHPRWKKVLVLGLGVALSINTALLQFSSTVLVLDLNAASVPGSARQVKLATEYVPGFMSALYHPQGSAWTRGTSTYPAFAEYHEPPPTRDTRVDDTGMTLRAYLPLINQTERESLQHYSGRATVVDTRVICARPTMANLTIALLGGVFNLNGTVASEISPNPEGPGHIGGPDLPAAFNCYIPTGSTSSVDTASLWRMVFCSVDLVSTAATTPGMQTHLKDDSVRGMAYLMLNLTSGWDVETDYAAYLGHSSSMLYREPGRFTIDDVLVNAKAAPSTHDRDQWLDMTWPKTTLIPASYGTAEVTRNSSSLVISASLCYYALSSAEMAIEARGNRPRQEPIAAFDGSSQKNNYKQVRAQLGQQSVVADADARAILQLQRRDVWDPPPENEAAPYSENRILNDFRDVGGLRPEGGAADFAVSLGFYTSDPRIQSTEGSRFFMVDPSLAGLFQEIQQSNGSIAFAVQSVMSVITGLSYYDQAPHFNQTHDTTQTQFVSLLIPTRRRGLNALICVVIVHLFLVTIITVFFTRGTAASALGNAWQTVAQVRGRGPIDEMLGIAALRTDSGVAATVDPKFGLGCICGIKRSEDWEEETVCVTASSTIRKLRGTATDEFPAPELKKRRAMSGFRRLIGRETG